MSTTRCPRRGIRRTPEPEPQGGEGDYRGVDTRDGAQFVEAEVAAGETFQIPGVPVGSACELREHDYVVAGLTPDIQWAAGSDRITDLAYHGGGQPNPKGEQNAVRFVVQPVASVDDGDDAGAWALTVRNTYPKVELKKTIAGALVGSNGSSILDTAVLEPGQPEMIIKYEPVL